MARGSGSSILFGEFGEGTTDKLKFSNLGISSFHRPSFLFIWPLLCPQDNLTPEEAHFTKKLF